MQVKKYFCLSCQKWAILYEHFHCHIIDRMMLCFQMDSEDTFDPQTFTFDPEPYKKPCKLPALKENVRPQFKLNSPENVVSVISKT